jgi:hypothetical protein
MLGRAARCCLAAISGCAPAPLARTNRGAGRWGHRGGHCVHVLKVACDRALLSCCVAGAVRLRTSAPACGDSAYGTGAARTAYRDVGVHTVIKSKPLRAAAPGGFALGNFAIDEPGCTVTCSSAVQTRTARCGALHHRRSRG